MTDQVHSDVSTEQPTHALTHRRALLAIRESHRAENRRKFLKYLEGFGEALQTCLAARNLRTIVPGRRMPFSDLHVLRQLAIIEPPFTLDTKQQIV